MDQYLCVDRPGSGGHYLIMYYNMATDGGVLWGLGDIIIISQNNGSTMSIMITLLGL